MNANIKGRLKLPAQEVDIPFRLLRELSGSFEGFIANTNVTNTFYKSSGWIFEADRPPLPTKPGAILKVQGPDSDGAHWMLLENKNWLSQGRVEKGRREMQDFLARNPHFEVEIVA